MKPPNIVLFYIDDLGWMDLGVQGSTFYETPQTDRLAKEGMRFTNAYSACPVCSPSRASLMSGKYPARVGFTGHITAIFRYRYPEYGLIIPPDDYMYLSPNEVSLARAIQPQGSGAKEEDSGLAERVGNYHAHRQPGLSAAGFFGTGAVFVCWPETHGSEWRFKKHRYGDRRPPLLPSPSAGHLCLCSCCRS